MSQATDPAAVLATDQIRRLDQKHLVASTIGGAGDLALVQEEI